jgi:hypothetical protein
VFAIEVGKDSVKIFTVHHHPQSVDAESDFAVIKEGFCWTALVFTAVWALWHRMWIVFLALVVAGFGFEVLLALAGADDTVSLAIGLGISLFVGYGANDWRRWTLARRGMTLMGVVAADDADGALHRYIERNPGLAPRRRASPDQVLGLP